MFRLCSKIRLYPTAAQETILFETLATCCDVYNSLLNWREVAWVTERKCVSRYEQQAALPVWKKQIDAEGNLLHPELRSVFSQVLQDVVHRVDLAYSTFFKRLADRKAKGLIKEGKKSPGKPRNKGYGHYDSFTYTQLGFTAGEASITLSKIGEIRAIVHRTIEGDLKTCTIRRYGQKWYACLCYEVETQPLPQSQEQVGIDVGLEKFAACSNGELIANPRFYRQEQKALAKAQRKLSKKKRGTRAHRKARKVVGRIHERIRNRRYDFVHKLARQLVNRYGLIAVEKLDEKNMMARPEPKSDEVPPRQFLQKGAAVKSSRNKSIGDAAWCFFRRVLLEKAARAARQVVEINPAYTSQDCSRCGYRPEKEHRKQLSDRRHNCPICGLHLDRDINATINILKAALQILEINTAVGQHCLASLSA